MPILKPGKTVYMSGATPAQLFAVGRDTAWADPYGGVVPYYPQQRYIDKNLAPEVNMTRLELEALAQANEIARAKGLMGAALADKMLPTLLTETYTGINEWGYPDTPKYRELLTKAGLPPTMKEVDKMPTPTEYHEALQKAQLMHAMMAAKAMNYGEDKAIERWNGQGTGFTHVRADAANHARKVEGLAGLLQHPKNKQVSDEYKNMRTRHSGGKDVPYVKEAPDIEEDESLVATVGRKVSDGLKKVRRAVREATSPTINSRYAWGGEVPHAGRKRDI